MKKIFLMMVVSALSATAFAAGSPVCRIEVKGGVAAFVDDVQVTPHQIGGDGAIQVADGVVALVKAGYCVPLSNIPKCDIKFKGSIISFYYGDDILVNDNLNQDSNALYNFGILMSNLKIHNLCN